MGWETRTTPHGRTHGPYYVRKTRDAEGRVRSGYVGRGPFAHELARFERLSAETEALQRASDRCRLAPLDDALAALRADAARLRVWRDAYLVATGHRSHRGQWRRRRGRHADGSPFAAPLILDAAGVSTRPAGADPMARKKTSPDVLMHVGATLSLGGTPAFTVPEAPEHVRRELAAALDANAAGCSDAHAIGRLRAAFAAFPAESFGPFLEPIVLDAVAMQIGTDAVGHALAAAEAARFAEALRMPTDGPLVAAAVAHTAAAFLVCQAVTAQYGAVLSKSHALALAQSYETRMTAAQTRYLRALATVAALRRAEGDERERAAHLDAGRIDATLTAAGRISSLPPPPDARERIREKLARLAAEQSGDSLPSPADVELVACADG